MCGRAVQPIEAALHCIALQVRSAAQRAAARSRQLAVHCSDAGDAATAVRRVRGAEGRACARARGALACARGARRSDREYSLPPSTRLRLILTEHNSDAAHSAAHQSELRFTLTGGDGRKVCGHRARVPSEPTMQPALPARSTAAISLAQPCGTGEPRSQRSAHRAACSMQRWMLQSDWPAGSRSKCRPIRSALPVEPSIGWHCRRS